MIDLARPTRAQVAAAHHDLRAWEKRTLTPNSIRVEYLWTLMLGLERNPEIAELAAAGVPHRSIDALYPPPEFSHMIPGIIEVITPGSYAELDGTEKWRELSSHATNLVRNERELRAQLDAETNRLIISEQYKNLRKHILDCLDGPEREQRAKAMALGIWRAYWGMQHLSATRWEPAIRAAFRKTVDWVLPELGK